MLRHFWCLEPSWAPWRTCSSRSSTFGSSFHHRRKHPSWDPKTVQTRSNVSGGGSGGGARHLSAAFPAGVTAFATISRLFGGSRASQPHQQQPCFKERAITGVEGGGGQHARTCHSWSRPLYIFHLREASGILQLCGLLERVQARSGQRAHAAPYGKLSHM